MAVANLIKFAVWCTLSGGQNGELWRRGHGAIMHEKAAFFLPVNILTVWSPAFLATRHTTMCLDQGFVPIKA